MKLIGILLREGRKEDLKKKYSDKFSEEDLNFVLNISDLQDFNHKYTDFILKSLNSENLEQFIEDLVILVKDFDKYNSQLEKKDINQYSGFAEISQALRPLKEKEKERELENKIEKIYEDDKFLVVKPKTEQASCKYGSKTKWCVTSKGSGHFGRYTSGSQSLYFIINKPNSTNENYSKIAIHFDSSGTPKYWDSQDIQLSQREVGIINYAFPEMIDAIFEDYKINSKSASDLFLQEVFNTSGVVVRTQPNFLGKGANLNVSVEGFETLTDLGPGRAHANVDIVYNMNLIDSYHIFITFSLNDSKTFSTSIGFMGKGLEDNPNFIDLGVESWGFDSKYLIQGLPQNTSDSIRNHIASKVLDFIKEKPQLQQKVVGSDKVWRPKRSSYGYTFGKGSKGLIGKLIKYLDDGYDNGTKLDFLEYIGKIKSRRTNGKKEYAHINSNIYSPSSQWRGHFSSFFASAKNAGIITYVKDGNKFIITKGPNFEDFKSGKLKAL